MVGQSRQLQQVRNGQAQDKAIESGVELLDFGDAHDHEKIPNQHKEKKEAVDGNRHHLPYRAQGMFISL